MPRKQYLSFSILVEYVCSVFRFPLSLGAEQAVYQPSKKRQQFCLPMLKFSGQSSLMLIVYFNKDGLLHYNSYK
jgi:hypothetical protein